VKSPFRIVAAVLTLSLCSLQGLAGEQAAQTVMTQGFNHVGLSVTDLDKSTRFFTDTLGWQLSGRDEEYPATFLTDGEMFLTLWRVEDPEKAVAFDRKNNVGLHHLAISVASFDILDELYERFKTVDGVIIEFAPELAYGGPTKHMMIREPSGNRLEFAHNPPRP
jgi:lactoylglutathione lyase